MVYHDHERVKTSRGGEIGDEVEGDLDKRVSRGWSSNRQKGGDGWMSVYLGLLARSTASNIQIEWENGFMGTSKLVK